MELRQLRYFVVLAEELHYGRAAARLRISTPTLSQQVTALERSVQRQLFSRNSHAVSLTDAGRSLLGQARLVLASADRARAALEEAGLPGDTLVIRVATGVDRVLRREFPALEHHPLLDVDLAVTHGLDAELAVLHGRADAAFVWLRPPGDPVLKSTRVATTEVTLAVSVEHELAELDVIPVARLREERIALFRRYLAPGVWDHFAQHLLPSGVSSEEQLLNQPVRLDPSEGMMRLVAEGAAVAPFVHAVGNRAVTEASGIALRPLDPPLTLPVELLWREPALPPLRQLIEELAPAQGSDAL